MGDDVLMLNFNTLKAVHIANGVAQCSEGINKRHYIANKARGRAGGIEYMQHSSNHKLYALEDDFDRNSRPAQRMQ